MTTTDDTLYQLLTAEPEDFLPLAYRTLLAREPDPHGAEHYCRCLASGSDRLMILLDIRRSSEGRRNQLAHPTPVVDKLCRYPFIAKAVVGLRFPDISREAKKRKHQDLVFDWLAWCREELARSAIAETPNAESIFDIHTELPRANTLPEPRELAFELFDKDYYLSSYPDVRLAGVDPYEHYLTNGWLENRNPSAQFDTHYYKVNNLTAPQQQTLNPLLHFAQIGAMRDLPTRPGGAVTLDGTPTSPEITDATDSKIAIHIHLYYTDHAELFGSLLLKQTFKFDLLLSTSTKADAIFLENYFGRLLKPGQRLLVRETPNMGRDIAPFLLGFKDVLYTYDFVCHLHSKRSPHAGFGRPWLSWTLANLFGHPSAAVACITYLAKNPRCGILFPDNYFEVKRYATWGGNEARLRALAEQWDIDFLAFPEFANFPAGSMAWFRTSLLKCLVPDHFTLEQFEAEGGEVEGTMAHVLERAIPLFASAKGWDVTRFYLKRLPNLPVVTPLHNATPALESVGMRWLRDTPAITKNAPAPLSPLNTYFNPARLSINWIIPDYGLGAGGHMTIFRLIQYLERLGHQQTVWIQNARNYASPTEAKAVASHHYRKLGSDVHFRFLPDDVRQITGDAVIATDCWTAFPAACVRDIKERFYLIQDYEPLFHPMGENYLIAELTYSFGFAALCAGDWLLAKAKNHGMWARGWQLAADDEYYYPVSRLAEPRRRGKKQIVFYSRGYTPRRAVALGIAAFEELARRRKDFEILLFGEPPSGRAAGFPAKELGILSPKELGDIYRDADVGVAFSSTNYSLIPLEMMACDLPVVELDCESTRVAFPDGSILPAQPTVTAVADAIEVLLDNAVVRRKIIEKGREFVSSLNWKESATLIEKAIKDRLIEKGHQPLDLGVFYKARAKDKKRVSVVIPTYNGGTLFKRVLAATANQVCNFDYDILVIDSSSTDGTTEFVKSYGGNVRLASIEKASFQHGATRNLGISLTDGEIIALLTQDSCPANNRWLQNLVDGFSLSPDVAGVFGRHEAYPEHNKLLAEDLRSMFDKIRDYGPLFSTAQGLPSFIRPGSVDWRMLLHFYSDNNSALRRDFWEKVPYPNVDWGEDQIWCWQMLQLGFSKAYVDDAVVYHSHAFDKVASQEAATSEGFMFADHFGYMLAAQDLSEDYFDKLKADSIVRATRLGIPQADAVEYAVLTRILHRGRQRGARAADFLE